MRPMSDSVQAVSTLRRWRDRIGISTRELARIAGVSATTVRNAERGESVDETTRTRITDALERALQRSVYAAKDDARAIVVRAEVELDAARAHLADVESAQDAAVDELKRDAAEGELWGELDDEATDGAETAIAA